MDQHSEEPSLTSALAASGVSVATFLDTVQKRTEDFGFSKDRTLAGVSVCRDELTSPLVRAIEQRWGSTFSLSGLAGVPSMGTTGWGAAISHIPNREGRGLFLVFGFPHLGRGPGGEVGYNLRDGQDNPTRTCGALHALTATLIHTDEAHDHNPEDQEISWLQSRIAPLVSIKGSTNHDDALLDVTEAALAVTRTTIINGLLINDKEPDHDVIVVTGLQLHDNQLGELIFLGRVERLVGKELEPLV